MLPREARLSREDEVRRVIRTKQFEGNSPLLYLVAMENTLVNSRLAVVTPKKLGNAVVRNRTRRIFAAAFYQIRHKIAKNMDFVFFPKKTAVKSSMHDAGLAIMDCARDHLKYD